MPTSFRDERGPWMLRLLGRLLPGRSQRAYRPTLLALEGRNLLSSLPAGPSADEQYMLQLINRARANPQVEASRVIALANSNPVLREATRGVDFAAFFRQSASIPSLPPLAFNTRLIAAARDHDAEMLATNNQKHAPSGFLVTGAEGRVAGDGKTYFPTGQSQWATGENVFAFSRNVNSSSMKDYVDYYHAGLLIDWGNPDFAHLKNIYAPGPSTSQARGRLPFSEIGIGLLANANPTTPPPASPDYASNRGLDVGPVILTQEFAWRSGNAFLAGAVYRDGDNDAFYTPGEGVGDVTIQAIGTKGEGTYRAGTWDSGGYSLALPAGTYTVTASGPTITTRTTTIAIGQDNVAWDLAYAGATAAIQSVPVIQDNVNTIDISTQNASTGSWNVGGTAPTRSLNLGKSTVPVPGDHDGDGRVDAPVKVGRNGQPRQSNLRRPRRPRQSPLRDVPTGPVHLYSPDLSQRTGRQRVRQG